jgi:hypothetical protein
MGIRQLYSSKEYYTRIDPKLFKSGQICWIITPQIDTIPRILAVKRDDPEEHGEFKFKLKNVDPDNDFRAHRERTLPLKYLRLESTEELLVQKAKKRPAIIISSDLDIYPEITKILKQDGKRHLQEDSLFLLPCYGTETIEDRRGFPQEMVTRICCLLYRQFFYLPQCSPLKEDSIVRLDRIQVVIDRHRAAIEPTDLCLSEELMSILSSLFMFCITGIEENDFAEIRSMIKESYPSS